MDTFEKAFPTAIRPQGKEIVRTWLYYTLLKSTLLLDKPGFKHVWIDGLGMDPWGRKMSKSLGNSPDPIDLMDKHGSDALRVGLLLIAPQGLDILFSEEISEDASFSIDYDEISTIELN